MVELESGGEVETERVGDGEVELRLCIKKNGNDVIEMRDDKDEQKV